MKIKKSKKDYLGILFIVITFLVATAIFSEWDDFKNGIMSAFN